MGVLLVHLADEHGTDSARAQGTAQSSAFARSKFNFPRLSCPLKIGQIQLDHDVPARLGYRASLSVRRARRDQSAAQKLRENAADNQHNSKAMGAQKEARRLANVHLSDLGPA